MIGLGDLVTGSVARVWDQVGVAAGEIPVVGWGNSPETAQEVLDGYVHAAHVAGPADDELPRAVSLRQHAPRAASRPASTSWSAPSTRRTAPRPIVDILTGQASRSLPSSRRPVPRSDPAVPNAVATGRSSGADVGTAAAAAERRPGRPIAAAPAPDRQPEFGPFVLLVLALVVFSRRSTRLPVAAQHLSNMLDLHGRAGHDRAGA